MSHDATYSEGRANSGWYFEKYHLDALFGPSPDGTLCFALPDTLPVRLCTREKEEKEEEGKGERKKRGKRGEEKKVLE